jgi:hypothetical protein
MARQGLSTVAHVLGESELEELWICVSVVCGLFSKVVKQFDDFPCWRATILHM